MGALCADALKEMGESSLSCWICCDSWGYMFSMARLVDVLMSHSLALPVKMLSV